MLTVCSGPYQPALESALLERIQKLKKDPLNKIILVTASSKLKDHLERLIAEKMGAVLNLHFHTLSSLALTLVEEAGALDKPVLSDPLFYDQLVKNLIRKNKPFESFEELAVPDGFPSAVRSTLRDLLDAGVDFDLIQAALEEKFVGRDVDVGSLKELLVLYKLYLETLDSLPVINNAKILERSVEAVSQSRFLKDAEGIFFYGFYDLTGRQVDLFESISKSFPTTLFFPYQADDDDFKFAKLFRDATLHRIGFKEQIPEATRDSASLPPLALNVRSAEIPRYPISIFNVSGRFDEAWLVAREIRKLLDEGLDPTEISVVARTRERLQSLPLRLGEAAIPFTTTAQTRLLDDPRAIDDLALLKKTGFSKLSTSWSELVEQSLDLLPALEGDSTSVAIRLAVRSAISNFSRFDLLKDSVSPDDFLNMLTSRLSESPLPQTNSGRGVSLLHAEAARGLSFKASILIGMEERVFPRVVREDPFLRDDARFALRDTIGYKIGLKLTALEEERLIFRLLTESAPRLIFIYQRSDDESRVVGASPYLRDFLHKLGQEIETTSLPRSPIDKLRGEKWENLSPSDVILKMQEAGQEKTAAALVAALGGDSDAYTKGSKVQKSLQEFSDPNSFDGLIGPMEWKELYWKTGHASASAIETFGKCPWQFFATKILNLEEPELLDPTRLPPKDKGQLAHGFLEEFFKSLTENGTKPLPKEVPTEVFNNLFEEKIPASIGENFGIPDGLWEILRLDIRETLRVYVTEEFVRLKTGGFQPIAFEKDWKGELPSPLNVGQWTGQIDRIDKGPNGITIVDYKTGKIPKRKVGLEAVQGRRAQPPLYLLIADLIFGPGPKSFSYHPVGRNHEIKDFSAEEWAQTRTAVLNTIRTQLDLMKKGVFPILPDTGSGESYCDYCDVNRICRKHHSISAYRAQQGAAAVPSEIRKQKLEKKNDE